MANITYKKYYKQQITKLPEVVFVLITSFIIRVLKRYFDSGFNFSGM